MAKAPAKKTALMTFKGFTQTLEAKDHEIAALLPSNVSRERFKATTIAAVKQNPALLSATPLSLSTAITHAATDGLMPDGREGVIVVYNTKNKTTNKWEPIAQWMPMTAGIRKRAKELDGIIVNAQVIYANDKFVWFEGDDQHIDHQPAQLGTDRGEMIGAYAIFNQDGVIVHREVMDRDQIEATRAQSRVPDSLMWTKFATEGWRKAVIRRGFKTVPTTNDRLTSIVERDNDAFDLEIDGEATRVSEAPERARTAPEVIQPGAKPLPPRVGEAPDEPTEEEIEAAAGPQETAEGDPAAETPDEPAEAEGATSAAEAPAEAAPDGWSLAYELKNFMGDEIGYFVATEYAFHFGEALAAAKAQSHDAVRAFLDHNRESAEQVGAPFMEYFRQTEDEYFTEQASELPLDEAED